MILENSFCPNSGGPLTLKAHIRLVKVVNIRTAGVFSQMVIWIQGRSNVAKSKPSKLSMNLKKNQSKKSVSAAAKGKAQVKKPAVVASNSKAKKTATVKVAVKVAKNKLAKKSQGKPATKQAAKLAVRANPAPKSKASTKSSPKPSSKSGAKAGAQSRAQSRTQSRTQASAQKTNVIPFRSEKRPTPRAEVPSLAKKSLASSKTKGVARSNMQDVFSPLDDRVLVERAGVAERTAGGLFIPDMVTERPNEGTVLAVGRGGRDKKGRLRPLDVRVGDKVMFTKWAGSECSIGEKELVILHESDIYGIVSQHSLR